MKHPLRVVGVLVGTLSAWAGCGPTLRHPAEAPSRCAAEGKVCGHTVSYIDQAGGTDRDFVTCDDASCQRACASNDGRYAVKQLGRVEGYWCLPSGSESAELPPPSGRGPGGV